MGVGSCFWNENDRCRQEDDPKKLRGVGALGDLSNGDYMGFSSFYLIIKQHHTEADRFSNICVFFHLQN